MLLQDIIHRVEVAGGMRYIRYALAGVLAAVLIVAYNVRVAKNFSTQEAMDTAQLARNLSDGKGYTTSFVRPLSMYLITERNRERRSRNSPDLAEIKVAHPDIANPPVYPTLLAGLMKVLPFRFEVSNPKPFWSNAGGFWRYQPDFLIQWFNELIFLMVIVLTYLWARRMFDPVIAGTSAIVLFGSELLWRFSTAGLSTMLVLLIFLGVVWCLTLWQSEVAEPRRGPRALMLLAVFTGFLVGLGGLTRYGFALLILPTLAFTMVYGGTRRVLLSTIVLVAFAAVIMPWLARNYQVSGTLFGTPGYNLWEGASLFPENKLGRSLHPRITFSQRAIWLKLLINSRLLLQREFLTFGGGWMTSLFLAGLLVGFRTLIIRRVRYFIVASLGIFFVLQALTRTQLSEDSPGINSENYLVILLPLVVVYAVNLFYLLLDQIHFRTRQLRYAFVGLLIGLTYLPVIFSLLPPRSVPVVFPPYFPPVIEEAAGSLQENELMMSDVPWAVAWYGRRQCVWLTLNAINDPADPGDRENFFAINDLLKPINGLYLTPQMMDLRLETDVLRRGPRSWGSLILDTLLRKKVSPPFPLRECNLDYLRNQQFFLTDWKRLKKTE